MTAFVLIAALTGWLPMERPIVAYFATYEACSAALNGLAAVHGDRLVGACYATGVKP